MMHILSIGTGEGGGRMASAMVDFGVNCGAINTNIGDLNGLSNLADNKKLLLEISGGGSGKDPNFVKEALKNDINLKKQILTFIKKLLDSTPIFATCTHCNHKEKLKDKEAVGDKKKCSACNQLFGIQAILDKENIKHDYLFIFVSLGGGSGSGLISEVIDLCQINLSIPIAVVCSMPDDTEDTISKTNAVAVFKELYNKYAVNGSISPFILIDNQKMMESLDLPIGMVYSTINNLVAATIDKFNNFSNKTSRYMSTVDTMDTARLWSLGGCCTMGKFTVGNSHLKRNKYDINVENFMDFNAIEDAIQKSTFVDGFDLSSTKGVGVIAIAPEHFLQSDLASKCIKHVFGRIKEITGANTIFRGQYEDDELDCLEFYIFYNGLKYPEERLKRMWEDIKEGKASSERKRNRLDSVNYDIDLMSNQGGENFRKLQNLNIENDNSEMKSKQKEIKKTLSPCQNCFLDHINKSSTGIYKKGGPIPFPQNGICPICKGYGRA